MALLGCDTIQTQLHTSVLEECAASAFGVKVRASNIKALQSFEVR
jgi:hypothetical protein